MSLCIGNGRLGNQIIRNLATSFICEKNDLYCDYRNNYEEMKNLGIDLFVGKHKYDNNINITDENYISILEKNITSNIIVSNYLQTKEICDKIYNYFHTDIVKTNIINKNSFKERYNNNNDLFIHVRLTDTAYLNPGIDYYINTILIIEFNNLYVSTDDVNHEIIKKILQLYPKTHIINYDEIKTIQFGSTCKNIILSHGSFSGIIGYLSFYSVIYYPNYNRTSHMWFGDMFSIDGWNAK